MGATAIRRFGVQVVPLRWERLRGRDPRAEDVPSTSRRLVAPSSAAWLYTIVMAITTVCQPPPERFDADDAAPRNGGVKPSGTR